ncbi:MAG: type II toxin-antitoxin system VapC family toxin [Promethearchaeota archaeon]
MKTFIDTDLAIHFLSEKKSPRGNKAKIVMKQIFEQNSQVYLTAFNYAEMLRGAYISSKVAANIRIVEEFVSRFTIVEFSREALKYYAQIYAELKQQGIGIGDFDELIASVVIANNGNILTNNVDHFQRINLLEHQNWMKY